MNGGVSVFEYGFVYDLIPRSGIRHSHATMVPKGASRGTNWEIVAEFGKSTYTELYLAKQVHDPQLFLVKDKMPSI